MFRDTDRETELSEEKLRRRQRKEEMKRTSEQFKDVLGVLGSYADRLASIVEDELTDGAHLMGDCGDSQSNNNNGGLYPSEEHDGQTMQEGTLYVAPKWTTENGLRGWIKHGYGADTTRLLLADALLRKSEKEQLKVRLYFLYLTFASVRMATSRDPTTILFVRAIFLIHNIFYLLLLSSRHFKRSSIGFAPNFLIFMTNAICAGLPARMIRRSHKNKKKTLGMQTKYKFCIMAEKQPTAKPTKPNLSTLSISMTTIITTSPSHS